MTEYTEYSLHVDGKGLWFSSPGGDAFWPMPPVILGPFLSELCRAQPPDVLSWCHHAVWTMYTESCKRDVGLRDSPPVPSLQQSISAVSMSEVNMKMAGDGAISWPPSVPVSPCKQHDDELQGDGGGSNLIALLPQSTKSTSAAVGDFDPPGPQRRLEDELLSDFHGEFPPANMHSVRSAIGEAHHKKKTKSVDSQQRHSIVEVDLAVSPSARTWSREHAADMTSQSIDQNSNLHGEKEEGCPGSSSQEATQIRLSEFQSEMNSSSYVGSSLYNHVSTSSMVVGRSSTNIRRSSTAPSIMDDNSSDPVKSALSQKSIDSRSSKASDSNGWTRLKKSVSQVFKGTNPSGEPSSPRGSQDQSPAGKSSSGRWGNALRSIMKKKEDEEKEKHESENAVEATFSTSGFPEWYAPNVEPQEASEPGVASISFGKKSSLESVRERRSKVVCALSPVGKPRIVWDLIGMLCLTIEVWSVPFELAFFGSDDVPPFFIILNYVTTAFFSCDIILNFFTGFINNGVVILDRRRRIVNYLRRWFWIDVVATMPMSLIFGSSNEADAVALIRMSRGMKAMKLLRFLRMIKLLRLVRARVQVQRISDYLLSSPKAKIALRPFFGLLVLAVLSHFHACVFASVTDLKAHLGPEEGSSFSPYSFYHYSFWWAYTKMTFGNSVPQRSNDERILVMVMATERLILLSFLIHFVVNIALLFSKDQSRRFMLKSTAFEYLKRHKIPYHLNLQVLQCLDSDHGGDHQVQHFENLVWKELPRALRLTMAEELWGKHLMSLGLVLHVARWHKNFVQELSLLVSEQLVPAQAIIFNEGEPASAAYLVLTGGLQVRSSFQSKEIPDFTCGMWIGEKALVHSTLLRSATVTAREQSSLMMLPGAKFQDLLKAKGLDQRFAELLKTQLRYGLCGRCGVFGDHFGDHCPILLHGGRERQSQTWLNKMKRRTQRFFPRRWWQPPKRASALDKKIHRSTRAELHRFLRTYDAEHLIPVLENHEVKGLGDLKEVDTSDLDLTETQNQTCQYLMDHLEEYEKTLEQEFQDSLKLPTNGDTTQENHYVFLSHFKMEAGTECSLMKEELEQIWKDKKSRTLKEFESPVFIDTEDLFDLEHLQIQVRRSHNLVLVLTENVLMRPWVAAEVVTAHSEGAQILLVEIQRPGLKPFRYPDEDFYEKLRALQVLDASAVAILAELEIGISDVEKAYRSAFKKIAVPFSPHKSGNIRRAELQDLLKRCVHRKIEF